MSFAPAADEVVRTKSVAEARHWAGLAGKAQEAIHGDLGEPASLRQLAVIDRKLWTDVHC